MPRSSAASKASRRVTTNVAPMVRPAALLGHDAALGGLLVVLADEAVGAGLERGHLEAHGLAARDHLFDPEVAALELLGRAVLVGDDQHERRARLDPQLFRLEPVLLDGARHFPRIRAV